MGVKQLPDFAQEVMKDQFHDLDYVKVYIDDIGGDTFLKIFWHAVCWVDPNKEFKVDDVGDLLGPGM